MIRLFLPLLLLCSTAHAGDRVSMSVAASDSLSTSTSCELLGAVTGTDAAAKQIPDGAYILRIRGKLTSIVTAASVTWWLALDSGGEDAVTDQATESIVDDDADGNGSINTLVNTGWSFDGDVTGADLYVCAKTDAGTATAVTRAYWTR